MEDELFIDEGVDGVDRDSRKSTFDFPLLVLVPVPIDVGVVDLEAVDEAASPAMDGTINGYVPVVDVVVVLVVSEFDEEDDDEEDEDNNEFDVVLVKPGATVFVACCIPAIPHLGEAFMC